MNTNKINREVKGNFQFISNNAKSEAKSVVRYA